MEIESGGILVEHVKGDLSFNVSKKKKEKATGASNSGLEFFIYFVL